MNIKQYQWLLFDLFQSGMSPLCRLFGDDFFLILKPGSQSNHHNAIINSEIM